MPNKTIVFCADGTWNGPGEVDAAAHEAEATNVYKLFLDLAGDDEPDTTRLSDEQERTQRDAGGRVLQAAKYIHGVGDSRNFLVRIMGGALGSGVITRIVRGYTFVSRSYEPGDAIVLVGFSRGAYTARALGAFIAARGLLDRTRYPLDDKPTAYRLGVAAWYAHRRDALEHCKRGDWLAQLQARVIDLPAFVLRPPEALVPAPVHAIAVWDTVGALGIPDFNRDAERLDAFQFCDRTLNPAVAHGVHAVSLDERRADFTPTLWDKDERIVQAIFPGAHSDVGGGYAESGLSDGALEWMTARLAALGVRFAASPTVTPIPNPTDVAHQPWLTPPFDAFGKTAPRSFSGSLGLSEHRSVGARVGGGDVAVLPPGSSGPYRPANRPPGLPIV